MSCLFVGLTSKLDVKNDNILISDIDGPFPTVKLGDLGLGRSLLSVIENLVNLHQHAHRALIVILCSRLLCAPLKCGQGKAASIALTYGLSLSQPAFPSLLQIHGLTEVAF